MARLIYGMMQSLDGYVAGPEGGPGLPMPGEALHSYFNETVRTAAGELYGRRMYEVMSYWDEDQADAQEVEKDFGQVWRARPKWVVSRTLQQVGPNATLLGGDAIGAVSKLKNEVAGEINVAGPELAASLGAAGLIDEYRLFLMPVVLGGGKPFFAHGTRPELEAIGIENLPQGVTLLKYRRVGANLLE